jgi:predicted ATP-grasp superfamily ATP-dependent carboligase
VKVLVTDAENKNALAAIRSLGQHGVTVFAGSSKRLARGFYSRYCLEAVRYPPPSSEAAFIDFLVSLGRSKGIDVVLPVGDGACRTISKHLAEVSETLAVPIAPWPAMEVASSKQLSMDFALRLGIAVPQTFSRIEDVDRFPAVVKRSTGSGGVRYINDRNELAMADTTDAVIQEWIPGPGYGFFALFDRGRERATFMHQRLREYPVTGGASTAAISIYDPDLEAIGLELLRALDWHGVAMVEVKKDVRDGRFKLMEINPKFWGSLDLSIAAGVDFPWATVEMAMGRLHGPRPTYDVSVRFQWVFDELLRVAAQPRCGVEVWRDFRDPAVRNDLVRDDPWPAAFDAAKTFALIAHRAIHGTLRLPHGAPRV